MDEEPTSPSVLITPANDGPVASARADDAVITLARLLGRQIAREAFQHRLATEADNIAPDDKGAF